MTGDPSVGWERRSAETAAAYRAVAERALVEAGELRDVWSFDPKRVELVDRLIGFLRTHVEHAKAGELPSRRFGFALTRFMDDFEWRPEGERLFDTAHELSNIWSPRPQQRSARRSLRARLWSARPRR